MVDTKQRYELLKKINGGHYYFKDLVTGGLAISDESIDAYEPLSPTQADDGELWVCLDEPIQLYEDAFDHDTNIALSIVDKDGEKSVTPIGMLEACYLVKVHGLKLHMQGYWGEKLILSID